MPECSKHTRSRWSSQVAFMLAASASAVGLGNLWRFPYLAAKYGGGIFLLVYLILVVTFGFSLMVGEVAIGKITGLSPIRAFQKLNSKFVFTGWILTFVPMIITPYYCVIGGWVVKYLCKYVGMTAGAASSGAGDIVADPSAYFVSFISGSAGPLLIFSIAFILLVYIVVLFGVRRGIEASNNVIMPLLIVMSVGLCVYTATLPGSMEGIKYYFLPDFSKFSYKTVLGAMGQMFYSLSLAMGIMITYGSYMNQDDNLVKSVRRIEIFDTAISLLAGFMIVPTVVIFSGADNINAGPGLMFQTLPKVFNELHPIVGAVFFLLVLFAALTSAISLAETCVASLDDIFGIGRRAACFVMFIFTILLAIPSALGYGVWAAVKICGLQFLDFFDFITNSVLMPIGAFLTCLFIGWMINRREIEKCITSSGKYKFCDKHLFWAMTRYIAPILLIAIFIVYAFGLKI